MPFPEAERVIYKKNPLDRVICQLRFPPILKIDTEIPAEFQERIRKDFPAFAEKEEVALPVPQKIGKEVGVELPRQLVPSRNRNYEFSSENGSWIVNLTRTFLALTTMKYESREDFRKRLNRPLDALVDIYNPVYFSRVGLRYIDVIKRSVLKLDNTEWSDLLCPHVLGLLGADDVSKDVQSHEARCEIKLEDGSSVVRIVSALVEWPENKEVCFMIDSDFYTAQKTDIPDAVKKLDYFHERASRLIQWLITKRLHEAMEPDRS